MGRPLSSSKRRVNLLDVAIGITAADLRAADKVFKEFFHVGVVYHQPSRRYTVALTGYGQRAHVGSGTTLGKALEMAFQAADDASRR